MDWLRRLADLLGGTSCEHEWVPVHYGYVPGQPELLAGIEACLKCGARIARCS